MKKYFIFLNIFIYLFLKVKPTFYLTVILISVDDYVSRIYNQKNETILQNYELSRNYPSSTC